MPERFKRSRLGSGRVSVLLLVLQEAVLSLVVGKVKSKFQVFFYEIPEEALKSQLDSTRSSTVGSTRVNIGSSMQKWEF